MGTVTVMGWDAALYVPLAPPCASSAAYARTVTVYMPDVSEIVAEVGANAPAEYGTFAATEPLTRT